MAGWLDGRMVRAPHASKESQVSIDSLNTLCKPFAPPHQKINFWHSGANIDLDQDPPVMMCYYVNTEGKGGSTKMHSIDLTGIMLIFISLTLFILAIISKEAYIVAFAVGYSFIILPLTFLTGA